MHNLKNSNVPTSKVLQIYFEVKSSQDVIQIYWTMKYNERYGSVVYFEEVTIKSEYAMPWLISRCDRGDYKALIRTVSKLMHCYT